MNYRILVVDDDAAVREVLRQALEGAGYAVTEAPDGEVAIDMVRRDRPDLVVTNIYMPEKEGVALIRELRVVVPELPIIAISGGGRTGNLEILDVARRFGATRTLAKPIDLDAFTATVAELLDARAASGDPSTE